MRIIEWPAFLKEGLPGGRPSAMTIGVFDGVHRGHKALIERTLDRGGPCAPVIAVFRENPKKAGNILSFRQKAALIESLGAEFILRIDFTERLSRLPGLEFIRLLEERGNLAFLALGRNFRCGFHRDTGAEEIQRMGVPTGIVEAVMEGSSPISSSRIRQALAEGRLEEAASMLGRNYTVDISEANRAASSLILPPPGRYAVLLHAGKNEAMAAPAAEAGLLRKLQLPTEAGLLSEAFIKPPELENSGRRLLIPQGTDPGDRPLEKVRGVLKEAPWGLKTPSNLETSGLSGAGLHDPVWEYAEFLPGLENRCAVS
ncbi:MAG: hypothetical protein LBU18_01950 [Treponema sp.]|jgi:riboflavin kinase/FMN adenylyltransferase|nr:hypothetical protein [Treponema sp.]